MRPVGNSSETITNRFPSAEEATEIHEDAGAVVWVHVAPKSTDVQTGPPGKLLPATTSLDPSPEQATAVHFPEGALACDQVAPESAER